MEEIRDEHNVVLSSFTSEHNEFNKLFLSIMGFGERTDIQHAIQQYETLVQENTKRRNKLFEILHFSRLGQIESALVFIFFMKTITLQRIF